MVNDLLEKVPNIGLIARNPRCFLPMGRRPVEASSAADAQYFLKSDP